MKKNILLIKLEADRGVFYCSFSFKIALSSIHTKIAKNMTYNIINLHINTEILKTSLEDKIIIIVHILGNSSNAEGPVLRKSSL